jgi:hypothetical protein
MCSLVDLPIDVIGVIAGFDLSVYNVLLRTCNLFTKIIYPTKRNIHIQKHVIEPGSYMTTLIDGIDYPRYPRIESLRLPNTWLHSVDDQPAVVITRHDVCIQSWYFDNKLHRDNGPACIISMTHLHDDLWSKRKEGYIRDHCIAESAIYEIYDKVGLHQAILWFNHGVVYREECTIEANTYHNEFIHNVKNELNIAYNNELSKQLGQLYPKVSSNSAEYTHWQNRYDPVATLLLDYNRTECTPLVDEDKLCNEYDQIISNEAEHDPTADAKSELAVYLYNTVKIDEDNL